MKKRRAKLVLTVKKKMLLIPGQSVSATPLDLDRLREQISKTVRTEAHGMIETTVKSAKKGQYLAMKYLFEMIGLFPRAAGDEDAQDDSLAKILLRSLNLEDEIKIPQQVTKDSAGVEAGAARNTVE